MVTLATEKFPFASEFVETFPVMSTGTPATGWEFWPMTLPETVMTLPAPPVPGPVELLLLQPSTASTANASARHALPYHIDRFVMQFLLR